MLKYIFYITVYFYSVILYATQVVPLNDKVSLPPSQFYHFSDQNLMKAHISSSSKPYFIGLKEGLFTVKMDQGDKDFLILKPKNYQFYKDTRPLIEGSLLDWSYDENTPTLKGPTHSKTFSDFLLKSCIENKSNVVLKLTPSPDKVTHPCLGHIKDSKKVWVTLMLVNNTRLKNHGVGAGAPQEVGWTLTDSNSFKLEKIFGELKAGREKQKSKGEFYFESMVSKLSPMNFHTGLEVGIQQPGSSLLSRSGVEWKKLVTNVELKLLDLNENQALSEINLSKMSRTGEKNVFKTEAFKKTHLSQVGRWTKLLTFKENVEDTSRGGPLGLSFLGGLSKSQSQEDKELWIKVEKWTKN